MIKMADLKLSCISDFTSFLALKDDWNNLLADSPNDTFFLRHEWISSWWMSYGGKSELNVLIFKKGKKLIGAAPLMIIKGKTHGLPVRKIAFIGDPAWTVEDFIITVDRKEAIENFIEYLLEMNWDIAEMRNIPSESENIGIFTDILKSKQVNYQTMEAVSSPYLKVDMPWEDFYARRSIRFKKSLRNKINKINKSGNIKIQKYSSTREVRQILPVIFDIGLKGWKHTINKAISSTEENKSFYTRLSEVMSGFGWLNIWLLEINGVPAAFEYHIYYKNRAHALIADFDENFRSLSPGSILDLHIMEQMFKNGVREYDMGCGDSFYKSNWTETAKKHTGINFYKNTFYGKTVMFVEKKIVPPLKLFKNRIRKNGRSEQPENKVNLKESPKDKSEHEKD